MSLSDALKRLAQCRANQPGMQVIVAADIVDAVLAGYCPECGAERWWLQGTDMLTCRRGHHTQSGPQNAPGVLGARRENDEDAP